MAIILKSTQTYETIDISYHYHSRLRKVSNAKYCLAMQWYLTRNKDRLCFKLLAIGISFLAVGCATIDVVPIEKLNDQQLLVDAVPVAHIHAKNWGYYFLNFVPLVTGNLENPGYPKLPAFFYNNVTIEDVVEKVAEKSRELGGTLTTDMQSTCKSSWQAWSFII